MLRVVGHPVVVNPDAELGAIAREEGWDVMRFEQARPPAQGRGRHPRGGRARRRGRGGGLAARDAPLVSESELSDDQREIRALARRFADREIAPARRPAGTASTRSRRTSSPISASSGSWACACRPSTAAPGADFLSYVLVLEELSRADAGVGSRSPCTRARARCRSSPTGRRSRSRSSSRRSPRAIASRRSRSPRPEAGSDAGALRTRAREGRITGAKQWITNGSHAHTFIVFARDEDDRISAYLVQRGAAGFRPTREEEKLGLNSSSTADLTFEDTPGERLGAPGGGMRIALSTLDGGRIGIAAQAVGIAQAALDLATAYAQERRAFGGPIARFQAIQQKLADMQTEIEAARALTWRAARLKQAGRPHTVEGAQAKLFASGVARRQTGEAIQVLGGYGYTKEFPVERYYRDAKVTEIYEGTSEIQRLVIARALLGEAARG